MALSMHLCRDLNGRLLLLMSCATVEYLSHTVLFLCAPLIVMYHYPSSPISHVGFYTAILSSSNYIGPLLTCSLWMKWSQNTIHSKAIILCGLASIGLGFFALILCQNFVQILAVRIVAGIFTNVIPVAKAEMDETCGNRQYCLATASQYLGIFFGALLTFLSLLLGNESSDDQSSFYRQSFTKEDMTLYYFPMTLVSMTAWIAILAVLVGLHIDSHRLSSLYVPVASREVPNSCRSTEDSCRSMCEQSVSNCGVGIAHNKQAENILRDLKTSKMANESVTSATGNAYSSTLQHTLWQPNPHFETIRAILPHYYHGYNDSGHLIIWDLIGEIKAGKLSASGFTLLDIRRHYEFFIQYAAEKLLKEGDGRIIYNIDLEGLTMRDVEDRYIECTIAVIESLQKLFPGILHRLMVLNTPKWINKVMEQLRPHIAKDTLSKMTVVEKGKIEPHLCKTISSQNQPTKYGGHNKIELGQSIEERCFRDFLRQTTGSLEKTRVIIKGGGGAKNGDSKEDEEDDEEAFFDCNEYGLDKCEETELTGLPLISSTSSDFSIQIDARDATIEGPTKKKPERFMDDVFMRKINAINAASRTRAHRNSFFMCNSVRSEPDTVLILGITCAWLSLQVGFDAVLPICFLENASEFQRETEQGDAQVFDELMPTSIPSSFALNQMRKVIVCFLLLPILFGASQLCKVQQSFSSMTPLAMFRFGLLSQIPVIGCFPLIDFFHLNRSILNPAIVTMILFTKHVTAAAARFGLMMLLDNSVPADRRLNLYRFSHVITYAANFTGCTGSMTLYAFLRTWNKPFPWNSSAFFFLLAGGLFLLIITSCFIPGRLNYPFLLSIAKH